MFDELTEQEKLILNKLSSGKMRKEICNELFITEHTLKSHIHNIYEKHFLEDYKGSQNDKAIKLVLDYLEYQGQLVEKPSNRFLTIKEWAKATGHSEAKLRSLICRSEFNEYRHPYKYNHIKDCKKVRELFKFYIRTR